MPPSPACQHWQRTATAHAETDGLESADAGLPDAAPPVAERVIGRRVMANPGNHRPPRVHTRRFREPGCPQLPAMEKMPETAEPGREGVRGQCAHRHPAGPVRGVGGDGFGSWSGAGRTAGRVGLRATPPTFPCLLSGDTPENISFLAVFRPMVFMFPTMFSLLAACHHAGMPRRAQRASSMPK